MILHYNLYPSNSYVIGSIVRFYMSECDPMEMVHITKLIPYILDSSIGACDFCDWDYKSDQGSFRITLSRGISDEAAIEAMNILKEKLIEKYRNIYEPIPC